MIMTEKGNLLLNLDKKKIIDPADLVFVGNSSLYLLAFVHEEFGNPFQYELFHLLMNQWRGDRITLVQDTEEARSYLTQEEKFTYHRNYKYKLRRRIIKEGIVTRVTIEPKEMKRWARRWQAFINQYVLVNYDSHLFITLDKRLYKQTQQMTPYFVLASAENRKESGGSWSTHRIGVEPIGTETFDAGDYFEMFRLIGNQSAIRLSKEDSERKLGLRD